MQAGRQASKQPGSQAVKQAGKLEHAYLELGLITYRAQQVEWRVGRQRTLGEEAGSKDEAGMGVGCAENM